MSQDDDITILNANVTLKYKSCLKKFIKNPEIFWTSRFSLKWLAQTFHYETEHKPAYRKVILGIFNTRSTLDNATNFYMLLLEHIISSIEWNATHSFSVINKRVCFIIPICHINQILQKWQPHLWTICDYNTNKTHLLL